MGVEVSHAAQARDRHPAGSCWRCGQPLEASARFCGACGARLAPVRPRRPPKPLLLAALAVVGVAVAAAAGLLVGRSQSPSDTLESAAGPSSGDAGSWQRIQHDEAVFGGDGAQVMSSVTLGGPGLVAVGRADAAAAVWVSSDGWAWQRIQHDEAVFGGDGAQVMSSVTLGGPGLIAVGYDRGRESAAVWVSPDGRAWQRIQHDEAVFGGEEGQMMMLSMSRGGPGFVAVGGDDGTAAVWVSSDGRAWQRVEHDEAVFGGPGRQLMQSVVAGGPGLVAVGHDSGAGEGAAAVWTSPDGRRWSRVSHDETVFGGPAFQMMHSVTLGGPGLVAVGEDGAPAAVWVSSDGRAWQRIQHDEAVFGGDGAQMMYSVTLGGPGLVAVGYDLWRESAAVWTSPPSASSLDDSRAQHAGGEL